MVTIQELQTKFDSQIQQVRSYCITIEEIEKTIDKLKVHHRDVKIILGTGTSAAIVGGLMAIVGFVLTPVTFGASVGLTAGGLGLAVAGGGTCCNYSIKS
jgi:hypothetical protein